MTEIVAIQSAIFAALGQYSALSDLVGARIYPDVAPQSVAKPYVVWQEISLVQAADLNGSAESNGLNNHRIQITSWAEGAKGASIARAVDMQVRKAMGAASAFRSLLADSRAMPYEPDTKLHGMQSDFSVWIKT